MQKTIDDATFEIDTRQEDWGEENLGSGMWEFSYREVKRLLKKLPVLAEDMLTSEIIGLLEDVEESVEPHELADASVSVSDADMSISLACAMIFLGGAWTLGYSGDSEYWFWHDLWHADVDYAFDPDEGITPGAYDAAERVAGVGAARWACEAGVSRGDVARQLVRMELDWPNRFGGEAQLLEEFLDNE